jgi:hypothetical protein
MFNLYFISIGTLEEEIASSDNKFIRENEKMVDIMN